MTRASDDEGVKLDSEALRTLKAKAEAATPGWWIPTNILDSEGLVDQMQVGTEEEIVCTIEENVEENQEFIAAANPQAVLGLISRIEKLEAALRVYDAGPNCSQSNVAREALKEET